jgi:hypothetical protein
MADNYAWGMLTSYICVKCDGHIVSYTIYIKWDRDKSDDGQDQKMLQSWRQQTMNILAKCGNKTIRPSTSAPLFWEFQLMRSNKENASGERGKLHFNQCCVCIQTQRTYKRLLDEIKKINNLQRRKSSHLFRMLIHQYTLWDSFKLCQTKVGLSTLSK